MFLFGERQFYSSQHAQLWCLLYHSEQHADYLSSLYWLILFSSPFFCSCMSTSEIILVATVSHSLIVSSFLYGNHCWCYIQLLGLLFSGFLFTSIILRDVIRFSAWCLCSCIETTGQGIELMCLKSGMIVDLHLDNSTAKTYFYNQSGTVFPFLSRLAFCILNLVNKHDITHSIIYTHHISVWKIIICYGHIGSRVTSSLHNSSIVSILGWTSGGLSINISTLWIIHCLQEHWGWMFQESLVL